MAGALRGPCLFWGEGALDPVLSQGFGPEGATGVVEEHVEVPMALANLASESANGGEVEQIAGEKLATGADALEFVDHPDAPGWRRAPRR